MPPPGKKAADVTIASLRAIGERANAQRKQFKVLAGGFRGSPAQITVAVKAVQTIQYWVQYWIQYWTRDPFGASPIVTQL